VERSSSVFECALYNIGFIDAVQRWKIVIHGSRHHDRSTGERSAPRAAHFSPLIAKAKIERFVE